jgi:cytochrome c oxidase cbb3-type subunit 3
MTDPQNEDKVLDHEYDGIREYDNPMPRWWLATLWGTVLFSVLYLLNVPVFGKGKGRLAEYAADSALAAERAAASDPLAVVTGDSLSVASHDPARLAAGRALFSTNCAACHAADGGGGIGPNLTDGFWLHGGRPLDIFRTAANGVAEKGMPTWKAMLSREQLVAVAGYVTTLRGTRPAAPKDPQGIADSSATQ